FWVFPVDNTGLSIGINEPQQQGTKTRLNLVGQKWQKIIISHTRKDETGEYWFYFQRFSTPLYIDCMMVEKGNKATDWTPAPEDTDEAINNLETKVENNTSELTVQA